MDFKLEICVDSVESAIEAQIAGANRIELCSNLLEGGTTPGLGTIISARNNLSIDLNVIIRPRGGDFIYSDAEFDIMRRDIEICRENGVDGMVLGILMPDGTVDIGRTAMLTEFARPMSVTFHRAYDMCSDPLKRLEDIIATGADRLLTSGMKNTSLDGIILISDLVRKAEDRIIIMPGGGINESNIAEIASTTGAKEFHMTARKVIDSDMIFRRDDISMGGIKSISEYSRKVVDPEMIKRIIEILKSI